MKRIYIFLFLISLTFFYFGCKKSESETPTGPGTTENYFPNNEGNNYKYSYIRIDSSGQSSGVRTTYYKGNVTVAGTNYKIQIDSLILQLQFYRLTPHISELPALELIILLILLDLLNQ